MPMMPFIGVRISWLMLARKADFERDDSSARAEAARSSPLTILELGAALLELRGAALDAGLNRRLQLLDGHLAQGHAARRRRGADAMDVEHDVLEHHPAGVLERTPHRGDADAEDRRRPQDAADDVIDEHHERRGHQHLRVAVHREEGQRSEDVEVGLDAAAGEMDQKGADGHLADGDDMAGESPPGRDIRQVGGQRADQSADHDRDPDVRMDRPLVPAHVKGEMATASTMAKTHCASSR